MLINNFHSSYLAYQLLLTIQNTEHSRVFATVLETKSLLAQVALNIVFDRTITRVDIEIDITTYILALERRLHFSNKYFVHTGQTVHFDSRSILEYLEFILSFKYHIFHLIGRHFIMRHQYSEWSQIGF